MHDDNTFSIKDLHDLSTDPAHLFMQLYGLLSEDPFERKVVNDWLADDEVLQRAALVEMDVLDRGDADPVRLSHIVGWSGDRAVFTLLRGLDGALLYVNPFWPAIDAGRLHWLARRYSETGRLNNPAEFPGALLPRCTYPGRPRGKGHKADFFGVHVVPPEYLGRKIDHGLIPNVHQPYFHPEQEIKVACAPFLADITELGITFRHDNGTATYRLAPRSVSPTVEAELTARMTAVIDKMDQAQARIGVLPEGCLSQSLLDRWRTVARETYTNGKPLRWLLLGSGPVDGGDPPRNRAVLVDRRSGETVLVHDKIERFTLDSTQVRNWRLPDVPKADRFDEDISVGSTIQVRDSALGRLAVVICQDMTSTTTWERELMALGLSHLFVPIFSKPILRYRWEHHAAARMVAELGTWVVVSNSLAVANAIGATPRGRWYTCLVAGPMDRKRNGHEHVAQYGRARSATDLGLVTQSRQRVLPTVFAGVVRPEWMEREIVPSQRRPGPRRAATTQAG